MIKCLLILTALGASANAQTVTVTPREYAHALRNPLMGFRADLSNKHAYSQLCKFYIRWRDIEDKESDGIDKIREYCDRQWREGGEWNRLDDPAKARTAESLNVKVIPRVYLHWSAEDEKYWPSDMTPGDYSSEQFKARALRLIERLGKVWDTDPRVAYIEMGLIGKWGEHHTPSITPEMQKLLGNAFVRAFPHKLVMVRHPWDFKDYRFGIYWDSFAHIDQMETHGKGIVALGDRWKTAPIGGESAYDWGGYKTQPGENPTDTVTDPVHRKYLIDTIRLLHANHVGWVANYDQINPEAANGADVVQQALGYRFVIGKFAYPAMISPGKPFTVSFTVRNTGSSPFYYNWPVALCLLDAHTRKPVWQQTFQKLDIRTWLPGDKWNSATQAYDVAPATYTASGSFTAPSGLAKSDYVVALAVLDPGGNQPSMRFSIENYFAGGYHPMGMIGIGKKPAHTDLAGVTFDDPQADRSIHYTATK